MARDAHSQTMRFRYHAGIDVPTPERSRLDVLRTKGLGQGHGTSDVIRIRLWLDHAPLLVIKGPITVDLKTTIDDAWSRNEPGCDTIRIGDQRGHR